MNPLDVCNPCNWGSKSAVEGNANEHMMRPSYNDPRKMAGVGIIFGGFRGQKLFVHELVPGGPAARSGKVRSGDVLLRIGDSKVDGLSDKDLAKLVLGPVGTTVTLFLKRRSPQGMEFEVRADVVRGWSSPAMGTPVGVDSSSGHASKGSSGVHGGDINTSGQATNRGPGMQT